IDPKKIKYIIIHHQDPDLCGLIPLIENILHPDVTILCESRTALFVPYYGSRKAVIPICDEDILSLKSGRELKFFHMPYLHFAGNLFTYDIDTASLFSSDIFGCFKQDWMMYSDESYLAPVKMFIEHYISSPEALQYAYDKLKSLKINRILPQHGAVIEDDIDKFIELLITTEPGSLLRELYNKATSKQEQEILETGTKEMSLRLNKKISANNLNELMNTIAKEYPLFLSILIDTVLAKASAMGVSNPLTRGRIHSSENIQTDNGSQLLDSLHKRYLSRQYSIMSDKKSTEEIMLQGLKALKANVVLMFIDIRGFTRWCADKQPDTIMDTLSHQHALISKIINSNGGRVNKIFGDGILAYFTEDYTSQSIKIAEKIQGTIVENKLLPVGIGMDFGKVIMGDLGEEARLDYTLIGSSVNIASRMCDSAAKGETAITMHLYNNLDDKLKTAISCLKSKEEIKVKLKPSDPEIKAIKFLSKELDTKSL
ncbi:MAG: hypothetical protein KOO69_00975, partial [Victivallales bacterium]|nr:hypothetical protein [Victivallales bacterium]